MCGEDCDSHNYVTTTRVFQSRVLRRWLLRMDGGNTERRKEGISVARMDMQIRKPGRNRRYHLSFEILLGTYEGFMNNSENAEVEEREIHGSCGFGVCVVPEDSIGDNISAMILRSVSPRVQATQVPALPSTEDGPSTLSLRTCQTSNEKDSHWTADSFLFVDLRRKCSIRWSNSRLV